MKISLIVLTYNRSQALLPVLRALLPQCAADCEILIADDGSRADEQQALFDHCPAFACPVRHVWHPDTGFTAAKARNMAASLAQGEYLIFLDGDCIPNPRFVAQHKRLAERGCFVNGSRVLLSPRLTAQVTEQGLDLAQQPLRFWLQARWQGDSNKLLPGLVWPWNGLRRQPGFVWRGIRSCNFGVWRSDFSAVNGFDETFEGWGHEDADLVLRLTHLGRQRKNGFMATEVFHLWHPHSPRHQESVNKSRVLARMRSSMVLAEQGLRELNLHACVKIRELS